MLKTTDNSSKKDNLSMSNSFSALNEEEEEDEEDVENVYDESANLILNTKAGGSSFFTAAAGILTVAAADLLRACPHHGFIELHQLDSFYNALNPADQDTLNSAAGGNLLERRTQDVLTIIENKSKGVKSLRSEDDQVGSTNTKVARCRGSSSDDYVLYYDAEMELMNMILLSIPNEIYNSVDSCKTAKEMWARVERLMSVETIQIQVTEKRVDYDEEYEQDDVHNHSEDPLASAMFINSGNVGRNNRRSYVQGEVVEGMNATNETANVQRIVRTPTLGNTSMGQCYNCGGKGHYARNCPKPRVRDSKMDEIEELSTNICLMARIQPADQNFDDEPSYESAFNSKRASMFYTSKEEIALNDFCRDQVKPLLNELLDYFDGFQNLFQRDIKEMKDAFEQNDVYLDEIERQNDLLKDQLLEASLKHDIELCVLLNHECVDKSLHDELEQVKKKSLEIQEGLKARIKILEKDVQRCEKQSVDFELKLQHEKEKHKWDSSKNKNSKPLDFSWISRIQKLEDENVSLDFKVQSLIKERDNAKMEYKKLFDSIKKTRSQTQKEMDELIAHVSEKTYAYGAIRAENQNLLDTISELKARMKNGENGKSVNTKFDKTHGSQSFLCVTPLNKNASQKQTVVLKTKENHVESKPVTLQTSHNKQTGTHQNTNVISPGMYRVVTQQESQTNKTKNVLSSTGMNATSSVKRPKSRDSHVKTSVLDVSKNEAKKEAVYVRKNKQTDNTFAKVVSNKENVIDVAVANASKAKTLLCVSCMQNVLIPCHDKCVAKHKLNVRSNARRTFSVNSRIPKSSETTFVAPKTRFSEKATQSKTLDTTSVASKSKIDEASASKARDKVSSAFKKKKRNMRDKPLSPFMLNKIRTSRLWQKWFESQPNVMWTPVNTKPHAHTNPSNTKPLVVQIVLWVVDSGCSKHMTGDRSLLRNFVEKFMGTVRFGNDNFAAITGYGDYIHGNITICHVYYVEGLGHNLFSVGQFCDGDLEVAFRSNTCYVRNLEGDDLLTGGRDSNLYTISISDMAASLPICLMSKATSTKSWLWHRRLSHLNFGTINDLTKPDLVDGLPKLKYGKDHLCFVCERGKSKKASHPPKLIPSDYSKLELLHMDLCGPMRVALVNGKKYILVIVDDFSRFTWIRTDNGTEFKNATLKAYYEKLGIMQQFSIARTPQQNGVVERRNRTLVEAARTMLIFSRLPEFLWAEAVATACFTQNRSIINTRHNKTPYELLRGRKPNVEYFHVFGSLCYPTNDRDDLGKMKPKADIGVFIGYSETSRGFRIYNRRTKRIMETIHVKFDELTTMASEHDCLEPDLQRFNNPNSSDDLMNTPSKEDLDNLFGPMFEDYFERKSSDTTIKTYPLHLQSLLTHMRTYCGSGTNHQSCAKGYEARRKALI
ncbi:retrovirus-related pol polyprotein from transposon TNT 1-94 [Tanacetum coccineum]